MEDHQVVSRFCEECVWAWAVRDHFRRLYERPEEELELYKQVAH